MFKAWEKGISTAEFRKCSTQDLKFINMCEESIVEKNEKIEHEARIRQAMEGLKKW